MKRDKLACWRNRLQRYLERPGYTVAVAAISALNSFIPFFPVELFMVLRLLIRPREWWWQSLLHAATSAIGVVVLAHLIELRSQTWVVPWLTQAVGAAGWQHATQLVHNHGTLGLTLVAISFIPLPPAVAICALSNISNWQIGFAVGAGHVLKYGGFAYLAAYSPGWFGLPDRRPTSAESATISESGQGYFL